MDDDRNFTAVIYGASGGFPDATSPGPADRGKSLFEGGDGAKATVTQTISLAAEASDIDTGKVTYELSAWVGGYAGRDHYATLSVALPEALVSHAPAFRPSRRQCENR